MAASHPTPVGIRLTTISHPRPSTLRMAPIRLGRMYSTSSPAISATQKKGLLANSFITFLQFKYVTQTGRAA